MNANIIEIPRDRQEAAQSAVCPLCHTVETSVSEAALAGGASWRCGRCGQRWDAQRLDTVAAYAAAYAYAATA